MLCEVCKRDIRAAFECLRDNEGSGCDGKIAIECSDSANEADDVSFLGHSEDWFSFCDSVALGCQICTILCTKITFECSSFSRNQQNPKSQLNAIQYPFQNVRHTNLFSVAAEGRIRMLSRLTASLPSATLSKVFTSRECVEEFYFVPFIENVDDINLQPSPMINQRLDMDCYVHHDTLTNGGTSNTGGPEAWLTAKAWLEDCLLNHKECARSPESDLVHPKRLIDLGHEDTLVFKLIDTQETPVTEEYAVSAHAWSILPPLHLCKSNLQQMSRGIALYSLPLALQETVDTVRKIGLRYLWIDEYCFIQDDIEEAEERSMTVGKIFSNALCTIAAIASRDPSESMFRQRLDIHARPASIMVEKPESHAGKYAIYSESSGEQYSQEHFNEQAWGLHQRVLSKRCLAFGTNSLYWQCCSTTYNQKSESCPQGSLFTPDIISITSGLSACAGLDALNYTVAGDLGGHQHVRNWWKQTIRHFTTCKVKNPEQRLPALSAVARACKYHLASDYMAGLWKEWLPYDLCWIASKPGKHNGKFAAPSWSWASVNEPISTASWNEECRTESIPEDFSLPTVKLLEHEIVPVGTDETGQLLSAWICVTGSPLPATLGHIQKMADRLPLGKATDDLLDFLEVYWDYINGRAVPDKPIFLLPLVQYVDSFHKTTKGIIIEDDPENAKGFFKRIGMFAYEESIGTWNLFFHKCLRSDIALHKLHKMSPVGSKPITTDPYTGLVSRAKADEKERWREFESRFTKPQALVLV